MTALTIVVIVAIIIGVAGGANALNKYSEEHYEYRPFTLSTVGVTFVAAILFLVAMFWVDPELGTYGTDAIVMWAASAILYLGLAVRIVLKTNVLIGVLAALIHLVGAAVLIFIVAVIFLWRHWFGKRRIVG